MYIFGGIHVSSKTYSLAKPLATMAMFLTSLDSFNVLHRQYIDLASLLRNRTNNPLFFTGSPESRTTRIHRLFDNIKQLDSILSSMKSQAQLLSPSEQPQALSLISEYQTVIDKQRSQLDKLQSTSEQILDTDGDSRQFETSHRIAIETTELGSNVLSSLQRQREKLTHTSFVLGQANQNVDTSNQLLKNMIRHMSRTRFFSLATIFVLSLTIVGLLYIRIIR